MSVSNLIISKFFARFNSIFQVVLVFFVRSGHLSICRNLQKKAVFRKIYITISFYGYTECADGKGGNNVYETEEQRLKEKLENVRKSGVRLFLEGKPASPEDIADKCVCENAIYMADYVLDDDGRLQELRYDRITDWK